MSARAPLPRALTPPSLRPWVLWCLGCGVLHLVLFLGVFRGVAPSSRRAEPAAWQSDQTPQVLHTVATSLMDQRTRIRLLVQLEAVMGRQAVPALLAATTHELPTVRQFALEALGMLADARALPAALAAVEDGDSRVASAAVTALGDLGAARGRAPLVRALDHSAVDVRANAADSLGYLDLNPAHLEALMAHADDPDARVRDAIHQAITARLDLTARAPQRSRAEWTAWWEQTGRATHFPGAD